MKNTIDEIRTNHVFCIMDNHVNKLVAIKGWCNRNGYKLNSVAHRNRHELDNRYVIRIRIDEVFEKLVESDTDILIDPENAWLIDLEVEVDYHNNVKVVDKIEIR